MKNISDFLPILGFILSIGLFGYGLKKILLKVENNASKN